MTSSDAVDPLELLTVAQVAQLLQVSPKWVYEKTLINDFPSVRIGRHLRIRRVDVEAYLQRTLQDGTGLKPVAVRRRRS